MKLWQSSIWEQLSIFSSAYLSFNESQIELCDKRSFWFLELHNHFYYCFSFRTHSPLTAPATPRRRLYFQTMHLNLFWPWDTTLYLRKSSLTTHNPIVLIWNQYPYVPFILCTTFKYIFYTVISLLLVWYPKLGSKYDNGSMVYFVCFPTGLIMIHSSIFFQ